MKQQWMIAAVLAAGLSNVAHAQQGGEDPWGDATVARADAQASAAARFDGLDANKDGFLSAEEMAASASGGMHRPGGGMGRADADGDGKISKQEYIDSQLRRFDRMDTNADGQLTKAERDQARAEMMRRMQEGGGWGGGGGGQ